MPQPKLNVELKKFHPEAVIPEYKSDMAAGFDLHACIPDDQCIYVMPGKVWIVPTEIGIFLDNPDYCLEIWERSGLGATGIGRRAGLVDADYQGKIGVVLHNLTDTPFPVFHKDRIAQAKIAPVQRVLFTVVEEFSKPTARGTQGYGSTGMR